MKAEPEDAGASFCGPGPFIAGENGRLPPLPRRRGGAGPRVIPGRTSRAGGEASRALRPLTRLAPKGRGDLPLPPQPLPGWAEATLAGGSQAP